eukprot:6578809-Alexandrium_andersonii.AAC.2
MPCRSRRALGDRALPCAGTGWRPCLAVRGGHRSSTRVRRAPVVTLLYRIVHRSSDIETGR